MKDFVSENMGPKKVKTRHSSGSCFGASASLPDSGNLFTVRDVLAALEREAELAPLAPTHFIATQLEVKIRDKWKEGNPLACLDGPKECCAEDLQTL